MKSEPVDRANKQHQLRALHRPVYSKVLYGSHCTLHPEVLHTANWLPTRTVHDVKIPSIQRCLLELNSQRLFEIKLNITIQERWPSHRSTATRLLPCLLPFRLF